MTGPTLATVKRLFATSGNRCAFPNCDVPIVDRSSGAVTGRIAHIAARSPNGPRFDPTQRDEQRHGFENLLLLCPLHHDVVDADVKAYTVARLLEMKAQQCRLADAGELDDADAATLLHLSMAVVADVNGSSASSVAQTGGQVANVIANYLASDSTLENSWSSKLREREADVLFGVWERFQKAYGAVCEATSPLQQFPDLSRMTREQREEFFATSDLAESEKNRLRTASDAFREYSEIRFWKDLSRASRERVEFHNYVTLNRILLREPIKTLLAELDSAMVDALIKLEIGKEADAQMRYDASRIARALEVKVSDLERAIHERLHGG
jgi:hypothetical protein